MVYIILERAGYPYYTEICYKVFVKAEPSNKYYLPFVSRYDTQLIKRYSNI